MPLYSGLTNSRLLDNKSYYLPVSEVLPMKKLIAVSVILILIAGILTACGSETAPSTSVQEEAAKAIEDT